MGQNINTPGVSVGRSMLVWGFTGLAFAATLAIGILAFQHAMHAEMPMWVLSRSSGIAAYLLLWGSIIFGMIVSHPDAHRWTWINLATRLRLHIGLSTFAVVFTLLHLGVLALDSYANVGWAGALVPMLSEYRPVPVTLGVLAFWGMVIAGTTAALANTRLFRRSWLWIHRISISFFVLAWVHGLLAGSDSLDLLVLYLSTGVFVLILATWRYATPSLSMRRKAYAKASTPTQVTEQR